MGRCVLRQWIDMIHQKSKIVKKKFKKAYSIQIHGMILIIPSIDHLLIC